MHSSAMSVNTKAEASFELRELRAKYAFLAGQPAADLSRDERRGVEQYLADTGAPTKNVTLRGWTRFAHELHEFITQNGRMPLPASRPGASAQEARLDQMMDRYRSPNVRDNLSSYQVRRLESIPGFEWEPLDRRWHAAFRAYQAFRKFHRHAPHPRSHDAAEKALARWALAQRIAANNRTLTTRQEATLWAAKYPVL